MTEKIDYSEIRFEKKMVISQLKVFNWIVVKVDEEEVCDFPDTPWEGCDVDCKKIVLQSKDNPEIEICFYILPEDLSKYIDYGGDILVKMWHTPSITKLSEFYMEGKELF